MPKKTDLKKTDSAAGVKIELNAVIVAVNDAVPQILIHPPMSLPSGPFETGHRTLEQGLRAWAGQPLGYVEQLYTFADRDRTDRGRRTVSIGYLALARTGNAKTARVQHAEAASEWSPWYRHFPWEDHRENHRGGMPDLIGDLIRPALQKWQNTATDAVAKRLRAQRIDIAFPKDKKRWNEELVLQRYELLWEAGLVIETARGGEKTAARLGIPMEHDHRRIVATAIARLRAKIKYRPVVFELMPDQFTLLQLQDTVEALAGLRLHKQNFRRLVEGQGLVEETGSSTRGSAGRPAKLFAFRRDVLQERAAAGTKLPRSG